MLKSIDYFVEEPPQKMKGDNPYIIDFFFFFGGGGVGGS